SPFAVLPSSHCSVPPTMRSTQVVNTQAPPVVGQTQPDSTVQRELQPSPPRRLASSHSSAPATKPSPQPFEVQLPPGVQLQPGSSWHAAQPSPAVALPSSHCSTPW